MGGTNESRGLLSTEGHLCTYTGPPLYRRPPFYKGSLLYRGPPFYRGLPLYRGPHTQRASYIQRASSLLRRQRGPGGQIQTAVIHRMPQEVRTLAVRLVRGPWLFWRDFWDSSEFCSPPTWFWSPRQPKKEREEGRAPRPSPLGYVPGM